MKAKTDTSLSVGAVSKRSGVAVSALHFYESRGLIQSWRSAGNQRRFHRDTLRRVAVIKSAQRIGISLDAIAAALNSLPQQRSPNAKDWEKLSGIWKAELDDRIRQLTQLRDELGECIGCGCLSMKACPLRNPDDSLAKEGDGAVLLK